MKSVVIYDSKFGNTEKVAQAIARGAGAVGTVQVVDTGSGLEALADMPDLVFIGGPTQRRTMSPGLRTFVESLAGPFISDVATAAFDTRYRGSTWLMGSAAAEASKRLFKAGGRPVAKPESFFIARTGPIEQQALEPTELDRAEAWGRQVSASVGATSPAEAGAHL